MFTNEQIDLARRLKQAGLEWQPRPGHYVYDEAGMIEPPSPFQERVYFILDLKHFLRRSGTIDELKRGMTWLPLWHQAREIASRVEIDDATITSRLSAADAFVQRRELDLLYTLILERLTRGHGPAAS